MIKIIIKNKVMKLRMAATPQCRPTKGTVTSRTPATAIKREKVSWLQITHNNSLPDRFLINMSSFNCRLHRDVQHGIPVFAMLAEQPSGSSGDHLVLEKNTNLQSNQVFRMILRHQMTLWINGSMTMINEAQLFQRRETITINHHRQSVSNSVSLMNRFRRKQNNRWVHNEKHSLISCFEITTDAIVGNGILQTWNIQSQR